MSKEGAHEQAKAEKRDQDRQKYGQRESGEGGGSKEGAHEQVKAEKRDQDRQKYGQRESGEGGVKKERTSK